MKILITRFTNLFYKQLNQFTQIKSSKYHVNLLHLSQIAIDFINLIIVVINKKIYRKKILKTHTVVCIHPPYLLLVIYTY